MFLMRWASKAWTYLGGVKLRSQCVSIHAKLLFPLPMWQTAPEENQNGVADPKLLHTCSFWGLLVQSKFRCYMLHTRTLFQAGYWEHIYQTLSFYSITKQAFVLYSRCRERDIKMGKYLYIGITFTCNMSIETHWYVQKWFDFDNKKVNKTDV